MKEYLLSVVGMVLFSSILLSIAPNGKMGELIKSIARMACILCILSPFLGLLGKSANLTSFFAESGIELQSDFIQYSNEARIAETEKILKEELYNTYYTTKQDFFQGKEHFGKALSAENEALISSKLRDISSKWQK